MNNEVYARIEQQLIEQATRLGAPSLGDFSAHAPDVELTDGEETRRVPRRPRERVLARLDALERFLVLLDRRTTEVVLDEFQSLGDGTSDLPTSEPRRMPKRLVAEFPAGTLEGILRFDLAELPDLASPLQRLRTLRDRIAKDSDG